MSWCAYCIQTTPQFRGIIFPYDFDDRELPRDDLAWVGACPGCYSVATGEGYDSDEAAAQVIADATGWPIYRSYDRDDHIDPVERARAGLDAHHPYFHVTLAEVQSLMSGGLSSFHGRYAKPLDQCVCGAYKAIGAKKGQFGHADYCPWKC